MSSSRIPKAVAVGETGLDSVRMHATPVQQRRLLDAHLELADELGLPVVIHNREADDETARALEAFAGTVVLHCFSSPGSAAARSRAPVLRVVRRQRDLSECRRAARRGSGRPARSDPRRDRHARISPRSRFAARATSLRMSFTPSTSWRRFAARAGTSSLLRPTRTRRPHSPSRDGRTEEGSRSTLPRRREHRPSHRTAE